MFSSDTKTPIFLCQIVALSRLQANTIYEKANKIGSLRTSQSSSLTLLGLFPRFDFSRKDDKDEPGIHYFAQEPELILR